MKRNKNFKTAFALILITITILNFSLFKVNASETRKDMLIENIPEEDFFESISTTDLDLISETENEKEKKDVLLILDKLNFYNPLKLIDLGNNEYKVDLADIIFEYGEVKLHVVGDNSEVPFSRNVKANEKILLSLISDDYSCEILVTDKSADRRITFIGKILNSKYELKWIDEGTYIDSSLSKNISIQATTYESEPNNSITQANTIINSNDMFGTMYGNDREDYYKITFNSPGKANFWLGQIPENKNHNLYVYKGSTLIESNIRSGLTQKLIQLEVTEDTYYIRVSYPSGVVPTAANYLLRVKLYSNLTWPVSNQSMAINACFGNCANYYTSMWPHNGIDLNAPMNTKVSATGNGTIKYAGRYKDTLNGTYGNFIDIIHTSENPLATGTSDKYIKTRYAHLDVITKSTGSVVQGEKIGESGKSGYKIKDDGTIDLNPYGAHLHFEILVGPSSAGSSWTRVQPLKYFPGKKCACGVSFSSIIENELLDISDSIVDTRNIGIYINDEYFIDIDTLLNMSTMELKRYGISINEMKEFIRILQSDEELYNEYIGKFDF